MPENKVVFGLEKLAFSVATIAADGSATYETPIMCPGARSISLDPQGDLTPWYADNMAYYVADDVTGYQGDVEVARFLDAIMAAIWKETAAANGLKYEEIGGASAVHFALLFEFKGDIQKTRHVFYNCIGTRPAVKSATTDGSSEPQTETSTITAMPVWVSALSKNVVKARCNPGDAAYDAFYTSVTLPTAGSSSSST